MRPDRARISPARITPRLAVFQRVILKKICQDLRHSVVQLSFALLNQSADDGVHYNVPPTSSKSRFSKLIDDGAESIAADSQRFAAVPKA